MQSHKRYLTALAPVILLTCLAAVWQWTASVSPSVLPPLEAIFSDLFSRPDFYFNNALLTLRLAIIGFGFGAIAGCLAAVLASKNRYLEAAFTPMAVTISVTPIIAITPALIIAFGFTDTPRIIVAALSSFFPLFINVLSGVLRQDKAARDVFRSLSASQSDLFFRIELPSALPSVFAGSKLAVTAAVIGTLVSEFTGTSRGLGAVIILATSYLNLTQMWAAIFVAIVMSMCLLMLVSLIERFVIKW